ncbi:GNAT family N-acetyltransferase [Paraflavitalea sp. CAU 1676]|uniref:GNAT family N-acetyltransferase n=1 Tax=Paraflavitalea sp. CAU 1676 TaxID=3032598 RepID=UPI0023DC9AAD|nr:GNAT family N-acetyltransferase [Paraflavitalea sp. CAU 1676]MDF2187170.1 GNAT family N-acetyltransferase [Paraflavitalea sp. CAU 1676]
MEPDSKTEPDSIIVRIANSEDEQYAQEIVAEMESSAKARGTGISKRSPASIAEKMKQGKGVIALTANGRWVGFSYLEVWAAGEFVSNSGLIVSPAWREQGVARAIKEKVFELSRQLYPETKIFSITTSMAIMKMNTRLGFEPVTFDNIVREEAFWNGCKSCVHYDILQRKQCRNCLCTAMLFIPGPEKGNLESGLTGSKTIVAG